MAHLYKVYGSKPTTHGYRSNWVYRVMAESVIQAAELAEKEHPDANIWNVVHCGKIDHASTESLNSFCHGS